MFSGGNGPAAIKPASRGAEGSQSLVEQKQHRLTLELNLKDELNRMGKLEASTCWYCNEEGLISKDKLIFAGRPSLSSWARPVNELKSGILFASIVNDEPKQEQENEDFLAGIDTEAFMAVCSSLLDHRIYCGRDRSLRQNESDESDLSRLLFGLGYDRTGTNDLGFYLGVVMMKAFLAQD